MIAGKVEVGEEGVEGEGEGGQLEGHRWCSHLTRPHPLTEEEGREREG